MLQGRGRVPRFSPADIPSAGVELASPTASVRDRYCGSKETQKTATATDHNPSPWLFRLGFSAGIAVCGGRHRSALTGMVSALSRLIPAAAGLPWVEATSRRPASWVWRWSTSPEAGRRAKREPAWRRARPPGPTAGGERVRTARGGARGARPSRGGTRAPRAPHETRSSALGEEAIWSGSAPYLPCDATSWPAGMQGETTPGPVGPSGDATLRLGAGQNCTVIPSLEALRVDPEERLGAEVELPWVSNRMSPMPTDAIPAPARISPAIALPCAA